MDAPPRPPAIALASPWEGAPRRGGASAGAGHTGVRPPTIDRRTSIYHDALAIIEAEYASDLRVADIAFRVAASRRQLQRSFAEIGHTTIRDHLTAVRMRHAAEMLASSRIPIREVAVRVGYHQAVHFAKVFRKHHGVPPSAFRTAAGWPSRAG